jgi:hypothetical protein
MMQESDTYQMILEEGEQKGLQKGARRTILLVGEERLGPPDEGIRGRLNSVTDLDRLDRMARCAARAASWQEILDTP